MPKICYKEKRFQHASHIQIARANAIIDEFRQDGFILTMRQLFYQFVSRELIPNKQNEYKKLGELINDARLAGLIDWDSIEDRTRNLKGLNHWDSPADIIKGAADSYHRDLWFDQDERVEVWIEKDALVGVIERVCNRYDVPFFSCRGYASQSEVWGAAMRHEAHHVPVTVLHLGDHDPNGIDMTRDIETRINDVFGVPTTIHRIALHMGQVKRYKMPPNPAKMTDSRFAGYHAKYGDKSWELDAMHPRVLEQLVEEHIKSMMDVDAFKLSRELQERERGELQLLSDNYPKAIKHLTKPKRKK